MPCAPSVDKAPPTWCVSAMHVPATKAHACFQLWVCKQRVWAWGKGQGRSDCWCRNHAPSLPSPRSTTRQGSEGQGRGAVVQHPQHETMHAPPPVRVVALDKRGEGLWGGTVAPHRAPFLCMACSRTTAGSVLAPVSLHRRASERKSSSPGKNAGTRPSERPQSKAGHYQVTHTEFFAGAVGFLATLTGRSRWCDPRTCLEVEHGRGCWRGAHSAAATVCGGAGSHRGAGKRAAWAPPCMGLDDARWPGAGLALECRLPRWLLPRHYPQANLAMVVEQANEQVLPAVYLFVGRSLSASPSQLGALTLCRALVQTATSPLSGRPGAKTRLKQRRAQPCTPAHPPCSAAMPPLVAWQPCAAGLGAGAGG